MSAGRDIAHMLLFEDFDPEEVERLASVPHHPSPDIYMTKPYSLGDEYHFTILWKGVPIGEWVLSRYHHFDDPNAEGFFIPNTIGEEEHNLNHAEGTREVVMIEIENWINERFHDIEEAEEFDPEEIASVADAALVEPYFEAVPMRKGSKLHLFYDKQFFRIYKDVKHEGRWHIAPNDRLVALRDPVTSRWMGAEYLWPHLEAGEEIVGKLYQTFPLRNGKVDTNLLFAGTVFKLRKMKANGP